MHVVEEFQLGRAGRIAMLLATHKEWLYDFPWRSSAEWSDLPRTICLEDPSSVRSAAFVCSPDCAAIFFRPRRRVRKQRGVCPLIRGQWCHPRWQIVWHGHEWGKGVGRWGGVARRMVQLLQRMQ